MVEGLARFVMLHAVADDDVPGRESIALDLDSQHEGMGRELFAAFRSHTNGAERGATIFGEVVE